MELTATRRRAQSHQLLGIRPANRLDILDGIGGRRRDRGPESSAGARETVSRCRDLRADHESAIIWLPTRRRRTEAPCSAEP